jgi:hypothetical protein
MSTKSIINSKDNLILQIGNESLNKTNNYTEWVEVRVKGEMLQHFGLEFARLVKTNQPYLPPIPTDSDYLPFGPDPLNPNGPHIVLNHGYSVAVVTGLKTKFQEELNKRKFEVEKKEGPKFYTELISSLSAGSLAVVQSHADFDTAEDTSNFSLLWSIIRRTHLTEYRGANAQAVLRERNQMSLNYFSEKQSPSMSLDEYFKTFKQTRERLTSLGVAAPHVNDQVQHFLNNLDRKRYQPLLDDLANKVNYGVANVYPATLHAAYELVYRFILPT